MAQWRKGNRAKWRCGLAGKGLLGDLEVWAKDREKWAEIAPSLPEASKYWSIRRGGVRLGEIAPRE